MAVDNKKVAETGLWLVGELAKLSKEYGVGMDVLLQRVIDELDDDEEKTPETTTSTKENTCLTK